MARRVTEQKVILFDIAAGDDMLIMDKPCMGFKGALVVAVDTDLDFSGQTVGSEPVLSGHRLYQAVAAPRQSRGQARENIADSLQ